MCCTLKKMEFGASHIAFFEERLREQEERYEKRLREQEEKYEKRLQILEEKYAALQAEHAALQIKYTTLQTQHTQLQSRYIALEAENKKLQEQVAALQERLGRNSQNSNLPPSSDKPGTGSNDEPKNGKRRKGKKRKRGGQPGHRGSHRALLPPEQVDHFEDHYPDTCESCWETLPKNPEVAPKRFQVIERFQTTELPPIKPVVTEDRAYEVECDCGHKTRSHIPDNVKSSAFGARLMAMIVMLTGNFHLSRRQAVEALKDFFNVTISVGAISAIEGRFAKVVKPIIEQAWKKAKEAAVKHTDGTSWLQAGILLQIWTIATPAVTVFKVLSDGTAKTLRALFANAGGILVSDRATALNFWVMKKRQICWSHLLRKFISFSERDGPAGGFGRELLDYTGIMFEYYWAYKDGRISIQRFRTLMAPVQKQFEEALVRAAGAGIKGLSGSCQNILGHREALWTFVTNPQVDPTNNHAERELRRFVLWRKRSFGSKSKGGNLFAERIMTVVHTARKQDKPLLPFLTEVCEAHRDGKPLPSLIS
jgi:transposase